MRTLLGLMAGNAAAAVAALIVLVILVAAPVPLLLGVVITDFGVVALG
jgi:hypothetical protein